MSPVGVYASPDDTADLNDRIDQAAQAQQQYQSFSDSVNQALVDQGAQWAQFQAMAQQHAATTDGAYNDFLSAVQGHLGQPAPQPTPSPTPAPGPTNDKQGPRTGMQDATPPSGNYVDYARQVATKYGVDPNIFVRQINQESGFNPNAKSPAGALGIAQFMPGTAQGMGVNPADPYSSLDGAARMMAGSLQKYGGDYAKALAAYNAGDGAVERYGGVPPYAETQNYVRSILGGSQSPATARPETPGSFAEQDVGGLLANMGFPVDNRLPNPSHVGETAPDNGPSPSDQQTPISTYAQQQPDGAWVQVQRMASGDYRTMPIAPPSQEAQDVYAAQSAATSGFNNPTENVPLQAGSTSGAQTAQPVPTPEAQAATAAYQARAATAPAEAEAGTEGTAPGVAAPSSAPPSTGDQVPPPAGPDNSQGQGAPSTQPQSTDIKSMLADALHSVANQIAGTPIGPAGQTVGQVVPAALNAAGNAAQAFNESGVGQFLNGNSGSFGVMGEPLTDEQVQQAADEAQAQGDTKTADMLLGTQQANKALQATAQAATVVAPEVAAAGDLAKVGGAAKAADSSRVVPGTVRVGNEEMVAAGPPAAEAAAVSPGVEAAPAVPGPNSAVAQGVSGSLYRVTSPDDAMAILQRSQPGAEVSGADLTAAAQEVPVTPKANALNLPAKNNAVVEFDPSVDVKRLGSQPKDSLLPTFAITGDTTGMVRSVTFDRPPTPDVRQQLADMGFEGETLPNGKVQYSNTASGATAGPAVTAADLARSPAGATPEAVAGDVGDVASQVVDHAAPVMAGAAQGPAPKSIADLNDLIGSFGQAIDKSATPAEAVRQVAQADTAATALAKGLSDEYGKFKLTPEENQGVADVIEGVSRVGKPPLRAEVAQVADALKATNDATWQMAHDAGVLDGMTENYFTHLVRVPASELQQMGGSITPGALSDWSRFAAGRARDEAGNVLNPTVQDLKDYLAQAHPTWQVVDDVPTVVAAHVRSLVTAADHAALADYLKAAVDADGQPLLSAVKRAGDVQLNVPSSLSKWLYRGEAPEEGTISVANRGGVLGEGGSGQGVVTQQPLTWARPDVATFIDRYIAPDLLAGPIERGVISPKILKLGNIYDRINRGIVTLKLMNPAIHTWNMLSETLKQYVRPTQAVGFVSDMGQANEVLRDPVALTKLLQEAPLNLSSVRQFASQLAQQTGRISDAVSDVPVFTGSKNLVARAAQADHNLLFNVIGQRLQLTSYFGAIRDGMTPVEAAKYANAKFGQFARQDFGPLTRWVNQHVAFAGNWTSGGLIQYGTLLKSAGYGGYSALLNPAEEQALTRALRGDLLRGVALGAAQTGLIQLWLTSSLPTDTYFHLPDGIRVPNPFFKREQDLVKLITGVGGSLKQGDVAGAVNAAEGIAANKAAPLLSAVGSAKDASTAIRRGGDFGTALERSLQYLGSVALPGAQPPQYKPSPSSGPVGTALGIRELNPPGGTSTGSGRPRRPSGPTHPR